MNLRRAHLVWPLLLLLLVGAALAALLPPAEEQQRRLGVNRRTASDHLGAAAAGADGAGEGEEGEAGERFTVIMQTYNRTDVLLRLLNHYQAVPRLRRIIIVWNNVGEQTPQKLWDSLGPHPVEVVFKEQSSNRMRNRLQSFPEIDTDGRFMGGSYECVYIVLFCALKSSGELCVL